MSTAKSFVFNQIDKHYHNMNEKLFNKGLEIFSKKLPPAGKFKFIKIAKMVIMLLHTFFKTSRAFVCIVHILTWAI